jgi:hypothetical protein
VKASLFQGLFCTLLHASAVEQQVALAEKMVFTADQVHLLVCDTTSIWKHCPRRVLIRYIYTGLTPNGNREVERYKAARTGNTQH